MKKELTALTGIRFIAAFYVFVYHVDLRIPFTFLHLRVNNIIDQGAVGVNIFFILSGFILTYSYYKKKIKYTDFIKKRLVRIYPAYFVGFLLCLCVSVPAWDVLGLDFFMLESYFRLAQDWYGAGAWSISTEFFFYFLFPLLLPFLLSKSKRALLITLPLLFIIASVPDLLHKFYEFDRFVSYSFPPSRLPEFISGIIGGILVFKYGYRVKEWIAITGILLLCFYFATVSHNLKGTAAHNFLIIPVTLLTLTVCVQPKKYLKWLGSIWMEYLGKISYGFYIVQIPVMLLLEEMLLKRKISREDIYLIPIILLVTLLLSIALYELIEMPVHRIFSKKRIAGIDENKTSRSWNWQMNKIS